MKPEFRFGNRHTINPKGRQERARQRRQIPVHTIMMNEKICHLMWGLALLSLYVVLHSIQMPLMRLCNSLYHSQTLALIFIGEVAFLLPLNGVFRRQWSFKTWKEWMAMLVLGLGFGGYYAASIFCSQHMHVGKVKCVAVERVRFWYM